MDSWSEWGAGTSKVVALRLRVLGQAAQHGSNHLSNQWRRRGAAVAAAAVAGAAVGGAGAVRAPRLRRAAGRREGGQHPLEVGSAQRARVVVVGRALAAQGGGTQVGGGGLSMGRKASG